MNTDCLETRFSHYSMYVVNLIQSAYMHKTEFWDSLICRTDCGHAVIHRAEPTPA